MSIWCSWLPIGWDDEGESVGGKVIDDGGQRDPQPHWEGGEVRSYADGWSNHYPDGTAEFPASVDVAHIPVWCIPGHRDESEHGLVGPWLRLSVDSPNGMTWRRKEGGKPSADPCHATVVMDEAAVRALHEQLGEWLDTAKAQPVEGAE